MDERIHIVIDGEEKLRYRRVAAREGKTLSEWLRDAAREKLASSEGGPDLSSAAALEAFFASLDEAGAEPDWEQQRGVIERSIARGAAET